jgi:hypothetical protein
MIDILISIETIERAKMLLNQQLPFSIRELWLYFQELSNCLWKIRDEVNEFVDKYPTINNVPFNFRHDPRFNDLKIKDIEDKLEKRMKECSEEAKRIEKEKEMLVLSKSPRK